MFKFKTLCFLLLIGSLLLSACNLINSQKKKQPIEELSIAPDISAQKEFYHAWLADCIDLYEYKADSRSEAKNHLENKAKSLITTALNTKAITDVWGTEKLVWGPSLAVDSIGNGYYVSKNLMYCVSSTTSTGTTYSIGISGTDMVSPYDWFSEDFSVEKQYDWPFGSGKISEGSAIGFDTLSTLIDPEKEYSLIHFLDSVLKADPSANITVTGHSLGGALTQVYSSYLQNTLSSGTPKVQAWVFAGPTAGNSAFADALTTNLYSYTSYSNAYDLIPHVWEADKVKELCNIYDGVTIYYSDLVGAYKIENDATIQGFINYLREISNAGDYKDPGLPSHIHTFNMGTNNYQLTMAEYNAMDAILEVYWHGGKHNDLYPPLNHITKMCNGGTDITEDQFYNVFYYLTEMGAQPTTAYVDYFFQDRNTAFRTAVSTAVPGGETYFNDFANGDEATVVLEQFLAQIAAFYTKQENCSCTKSI